MHLFKMLSFLPSHFGSIVAHVCLSSQLAHHSYLTLPHSSADDITFDHIQGQGYAS